MTALGFYNDKSSSISSNHHVKILIRSPSFKDTKMNVFYFRDNNIFKLLLEVGDTFIGNVIKVYDIYCLYDVVTGQMYSKIGSFL